VFVDDLVLYLAQLERHSLPFLHRESREDSVNMKRMYSH
jgi:hypothetical protein